MSDKIVGMYVHQHWSYHHPYAARTWTLEDWRGYLDGLRKLGYNTVLIWPVIETMPNPLTPTDRANLEKIAAVIDAAHTELRMRVYLTLCPNVAAKDAEARKYSFEERPFFYCDYRVDPRDPKALADEIGWREQLLRSVANADGVWIIDSDPGGYPGATNVDFAYLLGAHRRMFDRLRPGIELYYWAHAGWESYCRYYETGIFQWGSQEELEDAIRLLAKVNPEPWGLASGRGPGLADALGMSDRVATFSYGAIEGEPTFPMTNFGGDTAYNAGKNGGARGSMGNAQTHCLQLPNTFAFARGALGLSLEEADYVTFADDLIPGQGALIVEGWKALAGEDPDAMSRAEDKLEDLSANLLPPGPLKGLLFGDPQRFVDDLIRQLRLRMSLEEFYAVAIAEPRNPARLAATFERFIRMADDWQRQHGYRNMWRWDRMEKALAQLNSPAINEALGRREYKGKGSTPFEQIQDGYYHVETYTTHLIESMKKTLPGIKYDTTREGQRSDKTIAE